MVVIIALWIIAGAAAGLVRYSFTHDARDALSIGLAVFVAGLIVAAGPGLFEG